MSISKKQKLKKTARKLGKLYEELKQKAAELKTIIDDHEIDDLQEYLPQYLELDVKLIELIAHFLYLTGHKVKQRSEKETEDEE